MGQHADPDPDDDDDQENPEEFGTPVYQGTGLSVRALTAEELQRFLDTHADQPAERLGHPRFTWVRRPRPPDLPDRGGGGSGRAGHR